MKIKGMITLKKGSYMLLYGNRERFFTINSGEVDLDIRNGDLVFEITDDAWILIGKDGYDIRKE